MKVLFLDVDGVLNCTYTFQRRHERWQASGKPAKDGEFAWPLGHLDEELIARLNPIIEYTNCKIVISSSWRLYAEFHLFKGWLCGKGFKYPDAIIDRTPSLPQLDNTRGEEIKWWLNNHPEVVAYSILDDDCFDIAPVHPNNYVATNGNEGLTDEKMQAVITMLNK